MKTKLNTFKNLCLAAGSFLTAAILIAPTASAQPWERAIGGAQQENTFDIKTSDQFGGAIQIGGTWTYGATFSPNPPNVYVSQITNNGNIAQGMVFEANGWDVDADVVEYEDQIIWTTGVFNSLTGSYDIAVVSADQGGGILWTVWFGGFQRDGSTSIIATEDGQIIVAGYVESNTFGGRDGFLASIDNGGGVNWAFNYGSTGNDELWSVIESIDGSGDIYAIGYSDGPGSAGGDDVWLLAVDNAGGIAYSNLYGGPANDRGFDIVMNDAVCDPELTLTLVGETWSFGGQRNDIFVIRTLPGAGNVPQWQFAYEIFTAGSWDVGYGITDALNTNFSNVVISGQTNSLAGAAVLGEGFAFELGPNGGNPIWTRTYGGGQYETLRGLDTRSGGYFTAGQTLSYGSGGGDQYVLALDAIGGTGTRFGTACATQQFPNFVSVDVMTELETQQQDYPQIEGIDPVVSFEGDLTEICTPGLAPPPPFENPIQLERTYEQNPANDGTN